ncbi:alanine racemase [Fusobacterium russii]|uniref:alanine racemase n=1 Tax=Fusobacterium russii TaxID=854 RepID=UPI0003A0E9CF|nr:alanine racemase [Fusobacterium russii]
MRTWVEINSENLKYNVKMLKKLSNDKDVLGVVKANAYGLGAVKIAKILNDIGVGFLGVANFEEALELRNAGIESKILVLGASFSEDFKEAEKEKDIHLSVSSFETLEFIKNKNLKLPIHLKIDTGMTRLGFNINDAKFAIDFCLENKLNLKGIFSHLSDTDLLTDESKDFTLEQIEKFKNIINNHNIEFIHISNSAGVTNFSEYIFGNLVRLGLGMYGFSGDTKDKRLKNVFTLKSKVIFIKETLEASFVSYGRTFKLAAGETYAVLPIGYADGMKKYLSKGSYVLINNIKCPIIGSICMDMTMIHIPKEKRENIKVGDTAIILNTDIIDSLNIPELCTWDIMTSLGRRVKRIFI